MALENFRQVKLQMNKADGSILKTIYAKEDDYNGRELVVQITDDGIVRDLTGADVNLGWKNLNVGNQGLEPFTAVDSTQGTYKVVYPTEMLNKGEILCTIQLIYDGSMIHSRNFKIIIESNPVDSDAVESDNNFSVLQDALIRISTLEEGYAPRLNAVEGSVDSLTDYIGNLTTLTTVEKSNIVGALNEIDTNHKSHLAESVTQPDGAHGFEVEEGVWIPTLRSVSSSGQYSYDTREGVYTRQGDKVLVQFNLVISGIGTLEDETLYISGLPYIPIPNGQSEAVSSNLLDATGLSLESQYWLVSGRCMVSGIVLYKMAPNISAAGMRPSNIKVDSVFRGSIEYKI